MDTSPVVAVGPYPWEEAWALQAWHHVVPEAWGALDPVVVVAVVAGKVPQRARLSRPNSQLVWEPWSKAPRH